MKIHEKNKNFATISFNLDELLMINSALNETCNGIDVFEFETRTGFSLRELSFFLSQIGALIEEMNNED